MVSISIPLRKSVDLLSHGSIDKSFYDHLKPVPCPRLNDSRDNHYHIVMYKSYLRGSPTQLAAIAKPPSTEAAFLTSTDSNNIVTIGFVSTVQKRSEYPFPKQSLNTKNQQGFEEKQYEKQLIQQLTIMCNYL